MAKTKSSQLETGSNSTTSSIVVSTRKRANIIAGVPRFRTQHNAEQCPREVEVFTMPSLTVPEKTYTIPELMARMKRGQPLGGTLHEAVFHGEDEYFPEINKLDLAEQEIILQSKMDVIRKAKQQLKHQEQQKLVEKQAKEKFKVMQEEYLKRQQQTITQQPPPEA